MLKAILENPSGEQQIINESDVFWTVDKITFDGGIKQYITGAEFPCKGYTPPETLWACGFAKRLLVEGVKTLSFWSLFIGWRKLLFSYTDICWKVMSPHIMKYEYMTPVAQELQDLIHNFLIRLDVPEETATNFSKIFSHLIEYDNAYRYRVEDILSETTIEALNDNPRKEIKRLCKIS